MFSYIVNININIKQLSTKILYFFSLISALILIGCKQTIKGNNNGIKYLLWTPLISIEPTGVNDKYSAVHINNIVHIILKIVNNFCCLLNLFLLISVNETKVKTINKKK